MANDNDNRRQFDRVSVSLLVKVKYDQIDEFIDHFATNISPGGVFLQSRKPHPKGTLLKFEIQLKGGKTVLRGTGEVIWSRPPAGPGEKPKIPGMGIKFVLLDDVSKGLVHKILEVKSGKKVARPAPKAPPPPAVRQPAPPAQPSPRPRVFAKRPAAPAKTPAPGPAFPIPQPPMEETAAVDIDIDLGPEEAPAAQEAPGSNEIPEVTPEPLTPEEEAALAGQAEPSAGGIDIDVDLDAAPQAEAPPEPEPEPAPAAAPADDDLEGLDISVVAPGLPQGPTVELSDELRALATEMFQEEFGVDIAMEDFAGPPTAVAAAAPAPGQEASPAPLSTGRPSSRAIGIDLGTTNSCAAVVINGKPQVIPTRGGYRTLPSIIAYTDQGRLLIGHPAKAQMVINPRNTVYGSKRLVGRPYDSPAVSQMKDRFHYEIIEGPHHEAAVRIVGREFSLQQVAAFILSEIRDEARAFLKEDVNRAVITVPAFYNENQRQAVREAGLLAGLQVDRIVNEPTAAALAFGYNRGLDARVLIYDLGGGTFDASVLELCQNVYEVVATGGDTFLGGVDFDNQLLDYLLDAFIRQVGQIPELDRAAMQRLRDAAETAKCLLSEKEDTLVKLPYFAKIGGTPRDLEVKVTRPLLEQLAAPLVERAMQVASAVLEKAGWDPKQLNNILLVGGQSRMPLVWKRIREVFGKEPHKGVNPDEAVAVGAALLADSIGKIDSVVLIDVLPMSIGLGIPGGRFLKVLESGTSLPTSKVYHLRTFKDQQEEIEITIFQGESDRVVDNEYLGTARVSGISKAPKGAIPLEIMFVLDQECMFKVTARELSSGRSLKCVLSMGDTTETIRDKLKIGPEQSKAEIGIPLSFRKHVLAKSKGGSQAAAASDQAIEKQFFGKK